ASVYHGIIQEVSGARIITGYIFNGPDEYGYPSISYVGTLPEDQDAILIFSHTAETRDAGYSAVYFDNLGEYSDYLTVKEGSNSINTPIINEGPERWGDYSGNQRLYKDPGIVWVAATYAKGSGQNETWIAALQKPGYTSSTFEAHAGSAQTAVEAFPNPASHEVTIRFELPSQEKIQIQLFDENGRLIRTLIDDRPKQSGLMEFSFDTAPLASGLYLVQIRSGAEVLARQKVVVE
ncbi:MAG: T9SS type A sorting domain-containing protein, partial [Phaeodactylibacter sp.]|nr:T9SS type A sorting domain-containing protein [Phaeodactylibacter sp.]